MGWRTGHDGVIAVLNRKAESRSWTPLDRRLAMLTEAVEEVCEYDNRGLRYLGIVCTQGRSAPPDAAGGSPR
jgi:hypothetical protein